MNWLSENWVWILLLVGGYFLMTRMGMGGCGMGHSHGHSHAGGGHGGSAHAHNGAHDHAAEPAKLFDPVSQHMLPAETAIASVHQGHIYYFEDRANRDAFEAEPEKYLDGAPPTIGREIAASATQAKQNHRRHGCC